MTVPGSLPSAALLLFVASIGCAPTDQVSRAGPDALTRYAEPADPPGSWRSAMFPRAWIPADLGGTPDSLGRLLPDFSYAGYHRGEQHPALDTVLPQFEV